MSTNFVPFQECHWPMQAPLCCLEGQTPQHPPKRRRLPLPQRPSSDPCPMKIGSSVTCMAARIGDLREPWPGVTGTRPRRSSWRESIGSWTKSRHQVCRLLEQTIIFDVFLKKKRCHGVVLIEYMFVLTSLTWNVVLNINDYQAA